MNTKVRDLTNMEQARIMVEAALMEGRDIEMFCPNCQELLDEEHTEILKKGMVMSQNLGQFLRPIKAQDMLCKKCLENGAE